MDRRLERINALLISAASGRDFGQLFTGLCAELLAEGVPLWRASVSYQTLDPVDWSRSNVWQRQGTLTRSQTTHGEGARQFQASPIRYLREQAARDRSHIFGRWRLDRGEGDAFPLLVELRESGATDYAMHLVRFEAGTSALPGAGLSFASDRAGGFSDADLDEIGAVAPALALAACRAALSEITGSVLGVYLGARTARNVLAGEIRRGLGRRIEAAILLADLSGFTRLADSADPLDVVAWLNGHLGTMSEAVAAHGGEVLKFLGDGILAVFPVDGGEGAQVAACERALLAAKGALSGNEALNANRRSAGAPALALDIVLHYGEVIYGNVGSARRLDFTVVGRAVNEASRIETLCGELDQPLLLSSDFASRCGRPTLSLGLHRLRGVENPREICILG